MSLRLFTIPACGECEAVKSFLRTHGVAFTELDVAGNFANLRQMRRFSASRRVPVCVRNNRVVVGFDPEALRELFPPGEGPTV